MAFKQSKLNEIPQRNKDLTFGYVKECEKKNKSTIPSMIKYLCLIYLNQNKDGFDVKFSHKDIKIDGDLIKAVGIGRRCTTCLTNIINSGTHIWRFKCYELSECPDLIGIAKFMELDDKFSGYFDCALFKSTGYGWTSHGRLSDSIYCWGVPYGKAEDGWAKGDIIEMKVDFNRLELSYKVNQVDYGKAFDIEKGEYKAALTLYDQDGSYELVSYQYIY